MRRAWIMVYAHPPGASPSRMNRLHNRLFGYKGRSKYGRYAYESKGLLSGRAFLHLRRGVLALPLDVGEAARLLVEAEKARVWLRLVELTAEDEARMARAMRDQAVVMVLSAGSKKGSKRRRKRR